MSNEIDGSNKFGVGVHGDHIIVVLAPHKISKADALNLAAWLVTLADDNDEFGLVIEKVQNA